MNTTIHSMSDKCSGINTINSNNNSNSSNTNIISLDQVGIVLNPHTTTTGQH